MSNPNHFLFLSTCSIYSPLSTAFNFLSQLYIQILFLVEEIFSTQTLVSNDFDFKSMLKLCLCQLSSPPSRLLPITKAVTVRCHRYNVTNMVNVIIGQVSHRIDNPPAHQFTNINFLVKAHILSDNSFAKNRSI